MNPAIPSPRKVTKVIARHFLIVNREPGAGSRELLDEKLRQAGISASGVNDYTQIAHCHLPAVQAVLDVLNRAVIRERLKVLAGYDTSHTDEVLLT